MDFKTHSAGFHFRDLKEITSLAIKYSMRMNLFNCFFEVETSKILEFLFNEKISGKTMIRVKLS